MAPLVLAQILISPFDFDEPEHHKALGSLLVWLNRKGIDVFPTVKRDAVFLRVPIEHADALDSAVRRMLRRLGARGLRDGGVISVEIQDEDRYGLTRLEPPQPSDFRPAGRASSSPRT